MPCSRAFAATLLSAAVVLLVEACDDGAAGERGADGPGGDAGAAGAPVSPDAVAGVAMDPSCFRPCHASLESGTVGVIEQWRQSGHARPALATVPAGTCGNCHADDGVEVRLANAGGTGAPTDVQRGHLGRLDPGGQLVELGYAGISRIGQTGCTTCHELESARDPHVTGRYLAGQLPIRVAGGVEETVLLEKTAGASPTASLGQPLSFSAGNLCVFCHKSNVDVAFIVRDDGNVIASTSWGPHEAPQADLYAGKGGYELAGRTYGTATHTVLANGCVGCHMTPVSANDDVPDHSMRPSLAFCRSCHGEAVGSFDIGGGQSLVRRMLRELERALNDRGLLTRATVAPYVPLDGAQLGDDRFALDRPRPGTMPLDGATAGAVYDYLLIARGRDLGAHNPAYTKQLLWDSIRTLTGAPPTSLPIRPE